MSKPTPCGWPTLTTLETIYDVGDDLAGPLMRILRETATAVERAARADGMTIRQNSRPPGQEIPHLHFHVVPRFTDDDYWNAETHEVSWATRLEQASPLAEAFDSLRAH